VISRASEDGIAIITSAIEPKYWDPALSIANEHENVYVSIGLDPMQFGLYQAALSQVRKCANRIVSVGEVGLDHYRVRNHSERNQQEKAFREMISVAKELDIPLQVHSRSAGRAALSVLNSMDIEDVHMHAFDGRSSLARAASRDFGYYFSIPTSVVRSPQKRKLVKAVAIERLLVETDSPVLGPEKGVRNEPSNIWVALKEMAQILKCEEDELREIVLENTIRLYSRIQP
jgi:TatD DNase family protein